MPRAISYAQRYEDLHLLRAVGDREDGFYIDVGAGHPVYDNVSYLFYLKGWHGITVEPNPWLDELSAAVRPRDRRVRSLVGAAPGEATYYLVEDFHGLSTTVERNAQAALSEYGKTAKAMPVPVTTLADLCAAHAPDAGIDVLKIDVEGAERDVLLGNDWERFRPRVVVLEALAPVTLEPAWQAWEPLLTGWRYRFAFFDGLNRYYVAAECEDVDVALRAEPPTFAETIQFRTLKGAAEDRAHPDHYLAEILSGEDLVRLPLLDPERILHRLTAGLPPSELDRPATRSDVDALTERLFGIVPDGSIPPLHRNATIRELYAGLIAGERFRSACGRISASYAW